ncbi:hypothetical protein N8J89_01565 [Crossiella sp. CA-258035]|uniref:hypothetical protein n=1 Tax=Crossiella sp. CA-258035 TaxID=2981138 RepID=UPI0024BCDC1F|nr:hypothetical protein [Crossiella sp. CA-258035]WHT19796.1 hypothetical protein N8J89_01565 [Crossiella sp. CA-258035]
MAKDALSGGDGTQSPSPLPPMSDPLLPPRNPAGEEPTTTRPEVPSAPGDPEQLRAAIEAALAADGAAPPPGYAQATPFHQQVDPLPRRRFVPKARIPRPRMPDMRRALPAGGITPATLGFLALILLTLVLVYAFLSSFISWFSGLFS